MNKIKFMTNDFKTMGACCIGSVQYSIGENYAK